MGAKMTLAEMKEGLIAIDENLAQGERFLEEGYDCEWMMEITRAVRANLVKMIEQENH